MGFLQKSLTDGTRENASRQSGSSFVNLTEDQLDAHLGIDRYGSFKLTDAVRPSYDLQVVPSAGYRHDVYQDKNSGIKIPVLMAAATSENIFDIFVDLLEPLGPIVDVVLETSHEDDEGQHVDLYREQIDLPILISTLYDFEEPIVHDGCLGLAVLNPKIPLEVQFDEHKLLIMYGQNLKPFERILESYNVASSEEIKFITEAEHVHSTSEEYYDKFGELRYRLGIEE